MAEEQQPQVQSLKKPIWASWWFWLIIIAVIAIIIFTGGSKNGEITPETVMPTQEVPEDDFLIETDSSDKEETEPVSEQETQADFPVQEDEPVTQEPAEQDECSTDEECETGYECVAGACQLIVCQPDCAGKTCGDDGCGGSCGVCDDGNPCTNNICIANGICMYENKANETPCEGGKCINGECVCQSDCAGKECGDDGCGGVCGTCDPIYTCVDGQCIIPILDI